MKKLLEVKDLQVSFNTSAGEIKALRGISFYVLEGETLGIVGESGSGKSVTAHTIMGILPVSSAKIEKGEILFKGRNIVQLKKKELDSIRGNEIGIVFHDPMTSMNPTMKIGTQISEGLKKHKNIPANTLKEKIKEMLKLVSISVPEKRINQYPHHLSGGMRQRVMLASALACEPELLIADEPTTAVDVTIQSQILELMKDLQNKLRMSIILITHDMGVIADMCDRVAIMYAGLIIETGVVNDIFSNPQHPYTDSLLKSIPSIYMEKGEKLKYIKGALPDLFRPSSGCPFFPRCQYAMYICKEHMPDLEEINEQHYAACWLHHPMAENFFNKGKERFNDGRL